MLYTSNNNSAVENSYNKILNEIRLRISYFYITCTHFEISSDNSFRITSVVIYYAKFINFKSDAIQKGLLKKHSKQYKHNHASNSTVRGLKKYYYSPTLGKMYVCTYNIWFIATKFFRLTKEKTI